jgi:undecaprenyl-diphosphatase
MTTIIFTIILKELFLVPRPFVAFGTPPLAGMVQYSSLPSTHAAVAFAMATAVTLHQNRFGAFLFVIAAIIGIGRVAANVHYPTDVIIGLLIGVLIGIIFNQAHFYKWAKSLKKKRKIMSH